MDKFEELLVKKGLYDSINIMEDDYEMLLSFFNKSVYKKFRIDCYCPLCNEKRTFESVDSVVEENLSDINLSTYKTNVFENKISNAYKFLLGNRYSLSFRCTRDNNHILLFDLLTTDNEIIKIGQFPSFADITIGDINKYKSVLKGEFREFKKSIGLFSHGIGVGSFVYLRRIIEKLVVNEYELNKDSIDVSEHDFRRQEFKEKIKTVSDYIPSILSENANIYSILSKGVHELKEDECLEIFPMMKMAIELILDDIISRQEKENKEKQLKKFIANKIGELKK